jgi:hypothetical protein
MNQSQHQKVDYVLFLATESHTSRHTRRLKIFRDVSRIALPRWYSLSDMLHCHHTISQHEGPYAEQLVFDGTEPIERSPEPWSLSLLQEQDDRNQSQYRFVKHYDDEGNIVPSPYYTGLAALLWN